MTLLKKWARARDAEYHEAWTELARQQHYFGPIPRHNLVPPSSTDPKLGSSASPVAHAETPRPRTPTIQPSAGAFIRALEREFSGAVPQVLTRVGGYVRVPDVALQDVHPDRVLYVNSDAGGMLPPLHRPFNLKHPDRAELHALMCDEVGFTTSDDGGW